jgi:cold shock CspA family protein
VNGTIKALRSAYGFITSEGLDWFFHDDDVVLEDVELVVGDEVDFEPVIPEPEKGRRARDVSWRPKRASDG